MPNFNKLLSELLSSTQVNVNPTAATTIEANGVGKLQITFATSVPPSLQQYAVSSDTVVIPVNGKLKISDLVGVLTITPINVTVKAKQQLTGIINITPTIQHTKPKHVSVQVTNNTISAIIQDGEKIPPPSTPPLIYYTGFGAVQLAGYGVSLTIGDYDPIANVPAGNQIPVTLSGSTTQYGEAFSTIHRSSTGYIIIQNISGSGQFDLFVEDLSLIHI